MSLLIKFGIKGYSIDPSESVEMLQNIYEFTIESCTDELLYATNLVTNVIISNPHLSFIEKLYCEVIGGFELSIIVDTSTLDGMDGWDVDSLTSELGEFILESIYEHIADRSLGVAYKASSSA